MASSYVDKNGAEWSLAELTPGSWIAVSKIYSPPASVFGKSYDGIVYNIEQYASKNPVSPTGTSFPLGLYVDKNGATWTRKDQFVGFIPTPSMPLPIPAVRWKAQSTSYVPTGIAYGNDDFELKSSIDSYAASHESELGKIIKTIPGSEPATDDPTTSDDDKPGKKEKGPPTTWDISEESLPPTAGMSPDKLHRAAYRVFTRETTHAKKIIPGFPADEKPKWGGQQAMQAIAFIESRYGTGWSGEMVKSNNWGAIHCGKPATADAKCPEGCIMGSDSPFSGGKKSPVCFAAYANPSMGADGLMYELFRRPSVKKALAKEPVNATEVAQAMFDTGYYGSKDHPEQVNEYAQAIYQVSRDVAKAIAVYNKAISDEDTKKGVFVHMVIPGSKGTPKSTSMGTGSKVALGLGIAGVLGLGALAIAKS